MVALAMGSLVMAQSEQDRKDAATGNRSIGGSSFILSGVTDNGGGSYTFNFSGDNAGTDAEWIYQVSIVFPATWTVTAASYDDFGLSGGALTDYAANVATFTDNEDDCGYGFWYDGDPCAFEVTVNAPGAINGETIAYQLEGDEWGAEPHVLRSNSHPATTECGVQVGIVAVNDITIVMDSAVPTLSQWGMLAFVMLLAAAGVFFIRKR